MFKSKKKIRLTFDPVSDEPTAREFYEEYSKFNTNSLWAFTIFALVCLPSFCLELQNVSRDYTRTLEVMCIFKEFHDRHWDVYYIRNLTVPKYGRPCTYYDYNYSIFYNLKPQEAMDLKESMEHPGVKECAKHVAPENYEITADNFWYSCLSLYFKEHAYKCETVGFITGHIIFGIIGDLYGRKMGQYISYVIFTITVILMPLLSDYLMIMPLYFFKGMGYAGLIMLNYILFMELVSPNRRGIFTLYISTLGVVGKILGAELKTTIANNTIGWYLCAVPTLSLTFYLWYIPESPRWLLSYGMKKKAWKILRSLGSKMGKYDFNPPPKIKKLYLLKDNILLLIETKRYRKTILLLSFVNFVQKYVQFCKSSYITLKEVKAENHNFMINMVQLFSFLNVLPPFIMFGRNLAATWMNFSMAVCLLASVICEEDSIYYMMNLLALMSVFSMDSILFLFASEMLPTCARATGVGIIMAVGLGLRLALAEAVDPLTDMVSNPQIENLLCCGLAIFAIILLIPLPRVTHTNELPDLKRYF